MIIELTQSGIPVESEYPIDIYYKGVLAGSFRADIVVDRRLIIELKAVECLHKAHEVQLVNYLTATGIEDGLLVNFGENFDIKRKYRTYRPRGGWR